MNQETEVNLRASLSPPTVAPVNKNYHQLKQQQQQKQLDQLFTKEPRQQLHAIKTEPPDEEQQAIPQQLIEQTTEPNEESVEVIDISR